jgi:hypothetical protein
MTLLIKGLMSLIPVFAKEKLPKRNFNLAGGVVSFSSKMLVSAILLMTFKIQGFSEIAV